MQGISNSYIVGAFEHPTGHAPDKSTAHRHAECAAASVAGIRSGAGGPAYSVSKAGVINLVTVSAQQLCETNVRVSAICPGLTETGMTQRTFDYERDKGVDHKLGRVNLLRRAAQSEELAQVCSSRPTRAVMSTARPSRWTPGCRARIPSRGSCPARWPSDTVTGDFAWT